MKVYQISVKGDYKNFDGRSNYSSKEVYVKKPSQDDIDSFIDRCCDSEHPKNLYDLDRNSIDVNILELELIK